MKYLLVLLAFFSLSEATGLLTSRDFGNMLIKYANNDFKKSELKVILTVAKLYGTLWNSKQTYTKGIRCFVCRSVFFAIISLIKTDISDVNLIEVATRLCSLAVSTLKVCKGFLQLNMPILKYIIKTTPQAVPKTFCGILLQSYRDPHTCTYDDPRFEWQIKLPPTWKFQRNQTIFTDSTPLKVGILSDAHIDLLYEPFGVADCEEPTCCRKGQKQRAQAISYANQDVVRDSIIETKEEILFDIDNTLKILDDDFNNDSMVSKKYTYNSAGYWGDYGKCDTPFWAYFDVIDQIATHKVDIVYYVGDTVDHHNWETTYERNEEVNSVVINKMRETFGNNTLVVPSVGNHESQPTNQFAPISVKGEGLNTTWLYESLAKKWSYYLSKDAISSMKQRGGFSIFIRPGFRVISLNDIVAYKYNWWLLYDPLNPKRTLEWLVEELYKAEISGEKVHILSHIPAGGQHFIYTWTREYHRIVNRFSSTITAQFNGHLHSDEFKIFYDNDKVFNVAWGAGSATTYKNFNLNYKIATFDSNNFEPTSLVNYIYNLTEANLTPAKRPRWFKLYDMKDSFELQNLNGTSMDQLVQNMVTNKKHLLDLYVKFAFKLSDARPFCNTFCKLEMLCNAVTSVLWDRKKCIELKKAFWLHV